LSSLRSRVASGLLLLGIPLAFSTISRPATAADSSIEIASNEVYLDTRSGRLSGRLKVGYEDTAINLIAVIAPENSEVTLSYWRQESETCTAGADGREGPSLPADAARRSGAPTGPVVLKNGVREQKFVVKVGPLVATTTAADGYCLQYDIKSPEPLTDLDRVTIDNALDATVETLAKSLSGKAVSAKTLGLPLSGSPNASVEAQTCSAVLSSKAEITTGQFTDLFNCHLGWPRSNWRVPHPITSEPIRIRDAVKLYLDENRALREAIAKAWQGRQNATLALEELTDTLKSLTKVHTKLKSDPDGAFVYDPLAGVDLNEVAKAVVDPEVGQALKGISLDDRAAFEHVLYERRVALVQVPGRRKKLPSQDQEQKLTVFLQAAVEPKPLMVTTSQVADLEKGLEQDPNDAAKRNAALAKFAGFPTHEGMDGLLGFPASPDRNDLKQFGGTLKRLREYSANIDEGIAQALALKAEQGFKDLKAKAIALKEPVGVSRISAEASYSERFPFWVTADMGVAVGFFAGQPDEAPGDRAVSLAFGLAFYFTAMDKSEPLRWSQWGGRDFWRRASVTAGFTLTQPRGVSEHRIDGVLGDRLLMTGAGLRVTDYLRLSGGALYYTQPDSSPLSDRKTVKVAPYAMASMDIDVISTIQAWVGKAQAATPSP
jgi:hypothetical protein